MGIGLRLSLSPRLELSLRQTLLAPAPPNAVTGIDGIRKANEVLRHYGASGLLIGGLAKEVWSGRTTDAVLSAHKDVDVLILSYSCLQHPKQWEEGVDWWVTHSLQERPTNGTECGLWWTVEVLEEFESGLYLCPAEFLQDAVKIEKRRIDRKNDHKYQLHQRMLTFNEVKLIPDYLLQGWQHRPRTPVAEYCKP